MIAFIPARRGSKRLPRKALADLGGKPLIQWTIDAAQAAEVFHGIVVSSDDDDVLGVAHDAGVALDRRRASLAEDDVTLESVLAFYETDEPLYVLIPTSPFRSAASIREAAALFTATPWANGLLSVVEAEPPEHLLGMENGALSLGPDFHTHRAHLPLRYRHDGGHQIRTHRAGWRVPFFPPPDETLDINTQADLDYARWSLSRRRASAAAI